MGTIDGEQVHLRFCQFLRPLEKITGGTNSCAYPKATMRILGGVRVFQFFLNVFNGDQTFEVILVIHHQQLFHSMLVKNFFGFFERRPHRHRDEVVLGHNLADGDVEAGLEAQIAISQDSNQLAILGYWHSGNLVFAHDLQGI